MPDQAAMASDKPAAPGAAPTPDEQAALGHAARLAASGFAARAVEALTALLADNPQLAEAKRILGIALRQLGRLDASEAALRDALRLAPAHAASAVALAELLTDTDRALEAHEVLAPFAAQPNADIFVLTADATALKSVGRLADSLKTYERARDVAPKSAVAEHNLAGVLGDMQRFAESRAAAQRAFGKGLDAPETWLVQARALQGLGELDAAAHSFGEAIRRRPAYAEALGDLAQLIWMRTENIAEASAPLDSAIVAYSQVPDLRVKKARLLEYAGDLAGGYEALLTSPGEAMGDAVLQMHAAHLASTFDPPTAVAHAERAFALAPNNPAVVAGLAEAQLAAGAPDAAATTAQRMRERWPLDQHGIGLLAVAWRLIGDPRYGRLYDYQRNIGVYQIDPPDGWASLDGYLAELAEALLRLHAFHTHPIGQSVRHGSQTQQNLALSPEPSIQAFFRAIDRPIRRYIQGLGAGDDPLRSRIAPGYAFNGMWSVRLRPGGYHAHHLHQKGWISSACYIALPNAIEHSRQGWIAFGKPGVPTAPALEAEHFVKPQPGQMVLFPS